MAGGRGTPDQRSQSETQATAASARSIGGCHDRVAGMVRGGAVAYIARAIGAIAGAVPRRLPGRAAADIAASPEGLAARSNASNGVRNHDGRSWHYAWGRRGQAPQPWYERLVQRS